MQNNLIDREMSFLVLVDFQERLAPAISEFETVLAAASAMTRAAIALDVPVFFTEHCVDKVGATVESLRALAPDAPCLHKTHFGTLAEPNHVDTFAKLNGKRPIICGTETHVCVLQTAFGFLQEGYAPLLATDACGSRKSIDKATAIARMTNAGAEPVTAEMVIFEWLRRADNEQFRRVLPIIKTL